MGVGTLCIHGVYVYIRNYMYVASFSGPSHPPSVACNTEKQGEFGIISHVIMV